MFACLTNKWMFVLLLGTVLDSYQVCFHCQGCSQAFMQRLCPVPPQRQIELHSSVINQCIHQEGICYLVIINSSALYVQCLVLRQTISC